MIVRPQMTEVTVAPALDTNAYASGDRMGAVTKLANVALESGSMVRLADIFALDTDAQGTAFDILFFNAVPTVASADNAAIDISDAEMAKCVGVVSIAAADFKALANSKIAGIVPTNVTLPAMKPDKTASGNTGRDLWVLLICRSGTPTYTAAGLKLKFRFLQY